MKLNGPAMDNMSNAAPTISGGGTAQTPHNTVTELQTRLASVRARMRTESMSALIVTDPANIYYLTGYNAWSFYTPQCVIVPESGPVVLFTRAMDAAGAHHTCYLPDDHVEGYPEHLVHRLDTHPYEWIVQRGLERELLPTTSEAVIGAECDAHYFSARAYLSLVEGVGNARVVDSKELVNWVRLIKSDVEVQNLRIAGAIADTTMRSALDSIAPGRRQCDVAADILAAQASGTSEHGGDYPAIMPMMPTGSAAGTPHLTWSDAPFVRGEATTIELGGAYARYQAPIARTVMVGEADQQLSETAHIIDESMAATLEAMRPGTTAGAVHSVFNDIISRHGLTKESRIGYSIGIGYPPDWGERTVSLRDGEETELQAGMAFHVILGMWMDGWGYELSEPVVVTHDGVELLTGLPRELTIRK